MSITQELENFDEVFSNLKRSPIFLNDLSNETIADRNAIDHIIATRYTSDMVSLLPQCRCGAKVGMAFHNTVCDKCNTEVISDIEDNIEPLVWFRQPKDVEKLLNPVVWIMLEDRFNRSRFSVIQWLTNTSYTTTIKQPEVISKLIEAGFQRGYNYFVFNFFSIMEFLLNLREFRLKKNEVDYLKELIFNNKERIFSSQIPLPNKSLLVIEKTSVATFVDPSIPMAIDVAEALIAIDKPGSTTNSIVRQNRVAKALFSLSCKFYKTYVARFHAGKFGSFRQNLAGARFDFTARGVISSITEPHKYDEIHIPWGMGLVLFYPMIKNKLINKMGYLDNDATELINQHIVKWNPILDSIINELFDEMEYKRYPVMFNRFPSLLQGSLQLVWISKIKRRPLDKTISMPMLLTPAYNADFDGDQMYIYMSLDRKMRQMWEPLSPHFNVYGLQRPYGCSDNIRLPKPLVAIIGGWMSK